MTNGISLVLGAIIVGMLVIDIAAYGSEHIVFLGKKFYELIEWLAFWR